jgi:hypothetical protein
VVFRFEGQKGKSVPAESDGFEEFWKIYPRKVAKGDARKAWAATTKIRPPMPELLKAVYAARASKQWLKDDGDFIPHPATWLRQERWEDQHEVDLSQMHSANGKVCAYCGKPSQGAVNGIHACGAHWSDAMEGKKTKVVSIGSKADPEVVDKKLQSCGS